MDRDLWAALAVGEPVTARLRQLEALVLKWTQRINLISASTHGSIWSRHIEDSARVMLIAPKAAELWADFGAGGGFPALVLAVIAQAQGRGTRFVLVESDLRKATFLREAARQLEVPVDVRAERAEVLTPLVANIVSARALAPLPLLLGLTQRHMAADATALFQKGAGWMEEVETARHAWRFDLEVHENAGHKGSVVLSLRNVCRAGT